MSNNEVELYTRLAIAKGRNLIYYRTIDPRTRGQYIHVVRDFRKTLVELIKSKSSASELFKKIVKVIDPKVISSDCVETIIKIKKIYDENGL